MSMLCSIWKVVNGYNFINENFIKVNRMKDGFYFWHGNKKIQFIKDVLFMVQILIQSLIHLP